MGVFWVGNPSRQLSSDQHGTLMEKPKILKPQNLNPKILNPQNLNPEENDTIDFEPTEFDTIGRRYHRI